MASADLNRHYPLIAREGRVAVALTVVLGLGLYLAFGAAGAVPAAVAAVLLAFFFRDPMRDVPAIPLGIVSPVNGRVTRLEAAHDPWLGRDATLVTVRMGLFDVHSIFSPMEGKIVEQWSEPKAGDRSEVPKHAVAYLIQTDEGDDIVMEIARGLLGGLVRFYYQPGERIGHGRRIGFARLGCQVTTYAKRTSRIDCGLGDRVVAANSVVISMIHEEPVSAVRASPDQAS